MGRFSLAGIVLLSAMIPALAQQPDAERERDRKVLEAVFTEVMNPGNPLNETFLTNRNGRPAKGMVVHEKTFASDKDNYIFRRCEGLLTQAKVPKELAENLRLRNKGEPVLMKDLGIQVQGVSLENLNVRNTPAGSVLGFGRTLEEKYPDSWGYYRVSRPGYSADGKSAVVFLSLESSAHPIADAYHLVEAKGVWTVKGRWRYLFW